MAFPLPVFEEEEDNPINNETSIISDLPVENPFISHSEYTFNELTSRNLKYDSNHPVYSNKSCSVFISRNTFNPPTYYALKTSSYVKRIRHEFDVYQLIGHHPSIITCYDTWMQKGIAFLQLELSPNGSIRKNLFTFSNNQIWKLFSHIIFAIEKLHSIEYMHLDISPSNILQFKHSDDSFEIYKLTDFGTATKFSNFDEDCEGAGPYVSPEALFFPNTDFEVGSPTDIFSFGIVMMEIVTKKLAPRKGDGYQALRNGNYNFTNLKIPDEFSFIISMLNPNPNKRPTAKQLVSMEKVQDEIKKLVSNQAKQILATTTASTPNIPSNKLPPETPYADRYTKRKIIFDDEL